MAINELGHSVSQYLLGPPCGHREMSPPLNGLNPDAAMTGAMLRVCLVKAGRVLRYPRRLRAAIRPPLTGKRITANTRPLGSIEFFV
jgi:hypothetical protein